MCFAQQTLIFTFHMVQMKKHGTDEMTFNDTILLPFILYLG